MILAINTSTPQFGLALLDEEGTILSEYFMFQEKGHFGNLLPALHFMLSSLNMDIQKIRAIVAATGPGSFTGLRVGLSTAKGLCHALEIPVIGVSSLKALASQLSQSDLPIVPILYSRKNEFFTACFIRDHGTELVRTMKDQALKIDDLASVFTEPCYFIGTDFPNQSKVLKRNLGPVAHLANAVNWNLRPSSVGALGLIRYHSRKFDDPLALEPVYLRPPDIRPNPFPATAQNP